ncbi:hypothetical protein ACFPZ0_09670 [Streptomonospora nanhaiensis]|uniref:Uncharacterized protein n=1 Tax=Streptomonospora nanhaiensis TaxID=1323731 RepID=A0A853BMM6_9ACTN|nr:hypothetical protein [Streptomonospora nanhaiensis]NYI96728.1 hypothetical protein [Streptomonospora nanhaiensis]
MMANTGMAHGDAQAIAQALIALIEEGEAPPAPAGTALLLMDAAFLALALVVAAAAWRGVRRSRRWARLRAARLPWAVARLLPLALPPLLLAEVHRVVGFLYRGRDVAWVQVCYLYPAFMVLLAATALACVAVAAARVARLVRERAGRP